MVKIPQHKVTKFNKFFRASFSYFLSNPIGYLQRLSISDPANQLKDLGKNTVNKITYICGLEARVGYERV